MWLIFILYILFASTFTISKAALSYIKPVFFIGIRMSIAGVLILGYQYIFDRKALRFYYHDIGLLIRIMAFHIFFAYTLEFYALQFVIAAKACLLYNLSPFITALFARYIFSEQLTLKKIMGLIIGFVGFIPLLITQVPTEGIAGHLFFISVPEILLILSVMSSCYGWIVMKQLMQKGYSPITINGISMTGGGVLALLTSLFLEEALIASPFYTSLPWIVLYTGMLIIIANLICYNVYGKLLQKYSATFLSFAGFTTPLFAALLGWIFLKEVISWNFMCSVVIVFFGLYLFYQDELKEPK